MRTISNVFLGLCLLALTCGLVFRPDSVHAQNPSLTPWQLSMPAANGHSNCNVSASTTSYCFAGDGLFVSINGAAYTQVAAASFTGTSPVVVSGSVISCPSCAVSSNVVASFNGRTGAVQLSKTLDVDPLGLTSAIPASSVPVQ